MRDIAIRGFINDKFNTTFGKGLFRRAVFNGSVELANPKEKYLVDYYSYTDWQNTAKSDEQMAAVRKMQAAGVSEADDVYCSWILHYNPVSKVKTKVAGFSVYAPQTQELYICIDDPVNATTEEWSLPTKLCKNTGANKPVFIATNVDLNATQ